MTWSFSLMDAASCCEDDGQVAAVVSLPARQSSGCDWTSRGSGVVTHDVKGHQKASCFLSPSTTAGFDIPPPSSARPGTKNLHVLHADAIANAATMRCGKLRVHNASCSTRNISSTSTSFAEDKHDKGNEQDPPVSNAEQDEPSAQEQQDKLKKDKEAAAAAEKEALEAPENAEIRDVNFGKSLPGLFDTCAKWHKKTEDLFNAFSSLGSSIRSLKDQIGVDQRNANDTPLEQAKMQDRMKMTQQELKGFLQKYDFSKLERTL
ncbi:unnamed protein product [Amoebophrya sp. A25]|nr:unnamed protein product [Amoebophrya sp. A25]|eukprot:GSA25T00004490001.1